MSDKKNPVPDFTTWKLEERKAIFYLPGNNELGKRAPEEDDGENPFWYGYGLRYTDHSGNAEGWEFDYFGRGTVFKMWGLIKEDYFNGYAVNGGNGWKFFSGRTHMVIVSTDLYIRNKQPIGIKACIVRVLLQDTEREISTLTIPRDLILLPPVKPK